MSHSPSRRAFRAAYAFLRAQGRMGSPPAPPAIWPAPPAIWSAAAVAFLHRSGGLPLCRFWRDGRPWNRSSFVEALRHRYPRRPLPSAA